MNQIGNNKYVFKGWDWDEVAEYFSGTENHSEEDCEEIIDKAIDKILNNICFSDLVMQNPDTLKLRKFVKLVASKDNGYSKPLWQGLHKIQSDDVFLQYFKMLYKHLWT